MHSNIRATEPSNIIDVITHVITYIATQFTRLIRQPTQWTPRQQEPFYRTTLRCDIPFAIPLYILCIFL